MPSPRQDGVVARRAPRRGRTGALAPLGGGRCAATASACSTPPWRTPLPTTMPESNGIPRWSIATGTSPTWSACAFEPKDLTSTRRAGWIPIVSRPTAPCFPSWSATPARSGPWACPGCRRPTITVSWSSNSSRSCAPRCNSHKAARVTVPAASRPRPRTAIGWRPDEHRVAPDGTRVSAWFATDRDPRPKR